VSTPLHTEFRISYSAIARWVAGVQDRRMRTLSSQPTRVEQVYEEILAAITDGQLQPNERLIQDELATRLGVSRQPVQQALLLLRNDGLLREAPGRGLIVAVLDANAARDLYEIRAALEGLAARLAAERGAARAKIAGPPLLEAGRAAIVSSSVSRMVAADLKFHHLLYELSGNALVQETTEPHWRHMRRIMGQVLMLGDTPRRIWDEHEAILDAVIAGDAPNAEQLSQRHIMDAANIFIARLNGGEIPSSTPRSKQVKRRA
jgi:DNA-binding GntR family transcriptional regulator